MNKLPISKWLLGATMSLMCAQPLLGAGFALQEQSSTGQGYAFSGSTAGAEDISYAFFNPAALVRHEGVQLYTNASYILPNTDFKNGVASTAGLVPITGDTEENNTGEDAVVPALYLSYQGNHCLTFGLAVNSPFGLTTFYPRSWVGRYHAVKSSLKTVDVNPIVAWQPYEWLGVAVGFQANYCDATLSNMVDFGSLIAAPTTQDGFAELRGSDMAYGGTIGILIGPREGTRLGIAYRTQLEHNVRGDARFEVPAALPAPIQANFADTTFNARIKLPGRLHFGAYHELNEQWSVNGDIQLTEWHKFETLRAQFASGLADIVVDEEWSDTLFAALGATYRPNCCWAIRFGAAYDQQATPEERRTPRIPDANRYWLALGTSYTDTCFELHGAFNHLIVDNPQLLLTTNGADNDALRGNLSGEYDAFVTIFSLSGKFHF